ncbi:MAG TPA: DUF1588 domain-containing protein [Polyangiaceae bacterium]|nr:DUF1588 domain-containing protein [Polyangiaceae bacterium]
MTRLGLGLVLAMSGACLAACSAGSSLGGTGDAMGSGAASATGGKGGTTGAGGGGAKTSGGTAGTGAGGSSAGGSGATGGTAGTSGTAGTTGGGGSSMVTSCASGSGVGTPALRLLTRREFDNTINDIFPSIAGQWTDSLPANVTTDSGFDNDVSALVGNQLASSLADTALSIATAVTGTGFQNVLDCSATTKDDTCAQKFLTQTGTLLFRRALTDTENKRYLALFDQGLAASNFATAMKWVIAGLIQSPNTVYRSEVGTVANGARKLTGPEIATELAYTFGGSTPNSDLLTQFTGSSPPSLLSTATSLMQTPNGKLAFQHFFEQYLTYTGTAGITRTLTDPAPTVPYANVAADMLTETETFLDKIIVSGGGANKGSLADLLTSNKTYPTPNLSTYYGFPAPGSDGSVTRPTGQGLGVLAQGSFLSTHANSDYSSPTQRGLFVFYRLLCQPKQSPPGGVAPQFTSSETSSATTTRQLYEVAHMTDNSCKGCHAQFDPVGFGFENFDQGGRFRTQQNGVNVDPSGNVMLADGTMLFSFKNEEDLVQQLAQRPEVAECFSAYMSTYAFGNTGACLGSSNAQGLLDGSLNVVQAFANLATEPNFTTRNVTQ